MKARLRAVSCSAPEMWLASPDVPNGLWYCWRSPDDFRGKRDSVVGRWAGVDATFLPGWPAASPCPHRRDGIGKSEDDTRQVHDASICASCATCPAPLGFDRA